MLPLLLLACAGEPTIGAAVPTAAYDDLPAAVDLDVPFEALFAPDDPVVTLELTLINEVVAVRQLDPDSYTEGENPYRIRYAVYNLRNGDVLAALADAEDAGVDVQVLIEKDQLDPDKWWNIADEYFVERGLEYVESNGDDFDPDTVDLLGIRGSGLMHLKTRLFETPVRTRLLTGSMNPGDNAVFNDETLHLINDPVIVQRYADAYDQVKDGWDHHNVWDDDGSVNVLFSPAESGPRIGSRILDWLAEEDEQILLMVYSLRDIEAEGHSQSLVEILADRVAAGVPVTLITDRKQSDDYYDRTEDSLRDVGVIVYEVRNLSNDFTAMHHKVAVLGRTDVRVITDAANWTKAALGNSSSTSSNTESCLFIDSQALDDGRTGRRYLRQWLSTMERYTDQATEDGEPSAADMIDSLLGAEGWPSEATWFGADDARTDWGENVFVRGNQDALGSWGSAHDGLMLSTDGDLYPAWLGTEPAALPVGATVEWKYTAITGDNVRWESGDNRSFRAGPQALQPETLISASWR